MTRLLLVEDDADLGLALRVLLSRAGYDVVTAADGRTALRLLFAERPALMVLDLVLPVLDGWEVLDRTRDLTDLPVLILSGRTSPVERVRGLRQGADDYLVKPFDNQELLARVEALLRRARPDQWRGDYVEEGLRLVPERRSAVWLGREIRLSSIEYRLLEVLVRNRGRVVTTEQLLSRVWDETDASSGRERVKFAVLRLRRKLAVEGAEDAGDPLEAVRGLGYRYRG